MSKKPATPSSPTVSAEDFIVPAVTLTSSVKIAGQYVSAKSVINGLSREAYDDLTNRKVATDFIDPVIVDPALQETVSDDDDADDSEGSDEQA